MTVHAIPNPLKVDAPASSYRPPSTRVHPHVVRRGSPRAEETLRSAPTPPVEAPDMATRKKRAKVTAEQRAIAVARVNKLIGAGNPVSEAAAKVGKELGVSESAITNWRSAAKKEKPGAAPTGKRRVANGSPPNPAQAVADQVSAELVGSLASMVRAIVREEIRRMLA